MVYLLLKLIHIVSSTILFGTGIGTASVMLYAHLTKDKFIIHTIAKYVVIADWIFTAPSAVIQLVTGLFMVKLAGYAFSHLWIWGAILGYAIAGVCWFIVVYLQIKIRDMTFDTQKRLPKKYHHYFRLWFILGWPAFISLLIVFYLMTFKPS